jgi:threonine/homoserine/homoserine lactone efflux protein
MIERLIAILIGAFVLALSGALMPGPLFTMAVAGAARRGAITGPLLILGQAILELALVVAVVFGLGAFLKLPLVMAVIALLGGCILLWMGFSMVRSAAAAVLETETGAAIKQTNLVLYGILGSVSNPYWILWWATVGMGYLLSAIRFGWAGVAVFFIGHISADLLWFSAVTWSVSRGRKVLSPQVYKWAIRVCGIFLFGFGGWFLWTSIYYFQKH